MSTEKKSTLDSLDFEKLTEDAAGKLEGGFSSAIEEESADGLITINISKCSCTSQPTKPSQSLG